MDPFVRKLVERLFEPGSGLSRNRHFHTFENAEGRQALRISKRLRGLAADLETCRREGGQASLSRERDDRGVVRVELVIAKLKTRRLTRLSEAELELLLELPGTRAALGQ